MLRIKLTKITNISKVSNLFFKEFNFAALKVKLCNNSGQIAKIVTVKISPIKQFPFTIKLPIALTKLPASPFNITKYEINSEKIIFTITKAFPILHIQTPKIIVDGGT